MHCFLFIDTHKVILEECSFNQQENIVINCNDVSPMNNSKVFEYFDISIHVFGWNRKGCLSRLLNRLEYACYPSQQNITLTIWMDYNHTDDIGTLAKEFVWTHGLKKVAPFRKHMGLVGVWTQFWKDAKPNEIRLVFEDDIEVSNNYFDFFIRVMDQYFLSPFVSLNKNLSFNQLLEYILNDDYTRIIFGVALNSFLNNEYSCYKSYCAPIKLLILSKMMKYG